MPAKNAYGPVTPTSRFCSSFVFNAFGDVGRRLWNEIRFLDWQTAHHLMVGAVGPTEEALLLCLLLPLTCHLEALGSPISPKPKPPHGQALPIFAQ